MRKDMLCDQSGWKDAIGATAHIFCASMQLRTPLKVLLRHGEECPPGVEPPVIADEAWQGIWVPTVEGIGLWARTASQIGYIPADGGLFLRFLIAVREAIEQSSVSGSKVARLTHALDDPRWREFVQQLGGATAVSQQLLGLQEDDSV
ncbi:hypothetical protein [Achromobacter denitrificans]|uniref:hypothetical protein n=1 Tax=Achromobacter denitrificans TaxID=32002 RepID=UPI000F662465|nr:hypothetical protein [Achromobacter denitrificans]RSE85553.1 hypothetical protein EGU64_12685 [Achromobacter denitrificans]